MDPELEAIRAKRLAEYQQQAGKSPSEAKAQSSQNNQGAQEEQRQAQEAARVNILVRILTPEARERCSPLTNSSV